MARKDRLKEVYKYVRSHYPIHTQVEFAKSLKYNRAYISSAMNGNEKYLTDSLFKNICDCYPGVFNLEYLLTGKGILITPEEDAKMEMQRIDHEQANPIIDVNSFIDKAVEIAVSAKNETINVLKSQMADLRIQLVEKDKTIEDKNNIIAMLKRRLAEMEAVHDNLEKYPFPTGVADKNEYDPPRV